jgi:hypothetical protein
MVKSLGYYNKEKSSSADFNNIAWSKKNTPNTEKPKNKNRKKIPPTNNLPSRKKDVEESIEKVFKVELHTNEEKTKNKIDSKKFRESSASKCKIERGFKRPAR